MRGRVQGVGFRFFASERAGAEGLAGWTRNRDDGAVEIEVEGDREAVDRFERLMRQGPAGSRVESVEAVELRPQGLVGFEIRR